MKNGSRIDELKKFMNSERFLSVERPYTAEDIDRVSGSKRNIYTIAKDGSERLWEKMNRESGVPVRALGGLTGGQAVQMVRAGLEAVYVSGWQVAADNNDIAETYPDQSLYPAHSVPLLVERLNNALARQDLIQYQEQSGDTHWYVPLVADAEAGFGGPLNVYELMRHMIKAGAAGVHFEDQFSPAKKCGHLGGKVLLPTTTAIDHLVSARLAADVMGVSTVLIARTDANSAKLLTNDVDERDHPFIQSATRTREGFFKVTGGLDSAIARGLAYAPHADALWCETGKPDLGEAREFAEAIHEKHPGKLLAYNCSPSFNWKKHLDDRTIGHFQEKLGEMGYTFQFITLAGFHALNHSMFQLASGYRDNDMSAYVALQEAEFAAEAQGYTATKHQREVGTGYFDEIASIISGGKASTGALAESTESEQFQPRV